MGIQCSALKEKRINRAFFFVLFCFSLFSSFPLFCGSITLLNDSPFALQASIIAADGSNRGVVSVPPQQTVSWEDTKAGNAVWSLTPYMVIWECQGGENFGISSGVSPGATVSALSSSGARYCKPQKDQKSTLPEKGNVNPGDLRVNPNLGPP